MQKSATVAVIKDKQILILKRGHTAPWMPNKYCLPGGRVEEGESILDCAIRELAEETQIYIDNSSYLIPKSIKYSHTFTKTIFIFNTLQYEVILNWEHTDFKWVNSISIKDYSTVPSLTKIIQNLKEDNTIS
ncbi:MAG: NUDIX hydrolase [Proteobacteria bacterium]|nr:NUDIX hydrolase [Pseudomonadota bacterium]